MIRSESAIPITGMPKGVVTPLRRLSFVGDDAALVRGLCARNTGAIATFYQQYAPYAQRILVRVLGYDQDLGDALHEVFLRALDSIDRLRDPDALRSWFTSVAVLTAKTVIQRRYRRRWLRFLPNEELPEQESVDAGGEHRQAVRAVYAVLDKLPADERVAFSLRFLEGMELTDVANACDVSLATIKRRLSKAELRFRAEAATYPALAGWLEGGVQ